MVDFTGGDDNRAVTERVVEEFRRIGWGNGLMRYVDSKPLTLPEIAKTGLRQDKWTEAQTSQHNEFYWRLRSWRALTFVFPPISGLNGLVLGSRGCWVPFSAWVTLRRYESRLQRSIWLFCRSTRATRPVRTRSG